MGITSLPALLKTLAGKKESVKTIATHSPGKSVIGIDMSCLLMALVKSQRGAEEYHQKPPYPHHHVAMESLNYIRHLMKMGFGVIVVFDGLTRTPLKAGHSGETRDKANTFHKNQLDDLLNQPWPSTEIEQQKRLAEITKHRKGSAKVSASVRAEVMRLLNDNGIDYIVAPFEADWQLAYMFVIGLIHVIDTTDSDYWGLLDNPCVTLNQNRSDHKAHICRSEGCALLSSEDNNSIQSVGNVKGIPFINREGAILRAAIFGNDYVKGVHTEGIKFWEDALAAHGGDIEAIKHHYATSNKYGTAFVSNFEVVNNIYRHAPVFEMVLTEQFDVVKGRHQYKFTDNIIPLSRDVISSEQWVETIGFDPNDLIYSKYEGPADSRPSYTTIGSGEWFASDGVSYTESLIQRDKNTEGQDLPYGHDLDFNACPPVYQPVSTLCHWINVRGFQRRNRYDIIKTVNRMRRKKLPVMTEADCQVLLPRSIRYSSLEVMQ